MLPNLKLTKIEHKNAISWQISIWWLKLEYFGIRGSSSLIQYQNLRNRRIFWKILEDTKLARTLGLEDLWHTVTNGEYLVRVGFKKPEIITVTVKRRWKDGENIVKKCYVNTFEVRWKTTMTVSSLHGLLYSRCTEDSESHGSLPWL